VTGAYNPYFYYTMYPEYRGPSWWITDWYFGSLLEEYHAIREAREIEAERAYYDNTYTIDLGIKEQLRIQADLAMSEIQSGTVQPVSAYFNDGRHIFIASEVTPVVSADGSSCVLSHGDLLQQSGYIYEGQEMVAMQVTRAKRGSCQPGQVVYLDVSQLQEFDSEFVSRIELGMQQMGQSFNQSYRPF
jgi:hypothetical protein